MLSKIEELRSALHSKVQAGIILNAETLEMSRKLDVAINEYYASIKIKKEKYKSHIHIS